MGARRGGGRKSSRSSPPPPPPPRKIKNNFVLLYWGSFATYSSYGGLFATFFSLGGPFSSYGGLFHHAGAYCYFFLHGGGLFWACASPPPRKFLRTPMDEDYAFCNYPYSQIDFLCINILLYVCSIVIVVMFDDQASESDTISHKQTCVVGVMPIEN